MIKSIVFDLDETILDRTKSIERFISYQHNKLVELGNSIDFMDYKNRFMYLDNNGYTWKDKVYGCLIEEFEIKGITMEKLLEDYVQNFNKFVCAIPNLYKVLDFLKNKDIKMGIITNGKTNFQMRNIEALHIKDYFDVILISEKEGMKKPQPEIFIKALDILKIESSYSLFIGDHFENDIKGATNIGMKALLFDRKNNNTEYRDRIENLMDITKLI